MEKKYGHFEHENKHISISPGKHVKINWHWLI